MITHFPLSSGHVFSLSQGLILFEDKNVCGSKTEEANRVDCFRGVGLDTSYMGKGHGGRQKVLNIGQCII
jgi:hypothetical protein